MSITHYVGRGLTEYSVKVDGERGNHDKAVTFDMTDGFVGISSESDRVLLTPFQYKALVAFVESARKVRR